MTQTTLLYVVFCKDGNAVGQLEVCNPGGYMQMPHRGKEKRRCPESHLSALIYYWAERRK